MRTEYAGLIDEKFLGQTVTLYGWPIAAATTAVLFSSICAIVKAWSNRRDPDRPDVFETADKVRNEFVVEVKGLGSCSSGRHSQRKPHLRRR